MMEYKGYSARVEYDDQAGTFHGRVLHIRDVISFYGRSVDELREEFRISVDDYLEFCAERGEEPEKPYSGRFIVRIDPGLHRDVASAAARGGKSVNAWVSEVLEREVSAGGAAKPERRPARARKASRAARSGELAAADGSPRAPRGR